MNRFCARLISPFREDRLHSAVLRSRFAERRMLDRTIDFCAAAVWVGLVAAVLWKCITWLVQVLR